MYRMKEICEAVGLSYEGLKFYCNQGLVPGVKRDANGRRVFDEDDLTQIRGLLCLRRCSMSLEEMRAYLALCAQGEGTIPRRKELLCEKEAELLEQIRQLGLAVDFIHRKQAYYDALLAGESPAPPAWGSEPCAAQEHAQQQTR